MTGDHRIIISTKVSAKIPPYQYANVEIEKRIEVQAPFEECPEVIAFEEEAKTLGMSIRGKDGKISLRLLDATCTQFTIKRFLKMKKEIEKLPPETWEIPYDDE